MEKISSVWDHLPSSVKNDILEDGVPPSVIKKLQQEVWNELKPDDGIPPSIRNNLQQHEIVSIDELVPMLVERINILEQNVDKMQKESMEEKQKMAIRIKYLEDMLIKHSIV
jgi:hypothetical protein